MHGPNLSQFITKYKKKEDVFIHYEESLEDWGVFVEFSIEVYIGNMYLIYQICQWQESPMIHIGIYRNALVDGTLIKNDKHYNIKRIDLSDETYLY